MSSVIAPPISFIEVAERDEALIRERLEIYRATIAGNLSAGFTQVPDQVRRDPTLSRAAKLVYEQLLCYTRQKDCCWPSQQTIADDIATISRRTVIRALKELYERGYIEKWRRGLNRTNIYYINPLSFAQSFKRPWRGRGVLMDAHAPEILSSVADTPLPDVLARLNVPADPMSGKCQNGTAKSDEMALPDAPNWHTNHTESKHIENQTYPEGKSKIRRGEAAKPEKGTASPTPTGACSHMAHRTIGNEQHVPNTNTEESSNSPQQNNSVKHIEPSNQSKAEETGRPARAKGVEEKKKSTKPRTFEDMATLVGIAPEALEDMLTWLKENGRPAFTPLKLQGQIPVWSRELGNADPALVAANITQASKIYQYARLRGLSQQVVEDCLENAREAVRNHPEVVKKMAFFFTSLKLDILVALKQCRQLPADEDLVFDGYENQAKHQAAPPASSFTVLPDDARRTLVNAQRARAAQDYADLGIDREALMAMAPEERVAFLKQRRAQQQHEAATSADPAS